MRNTFMPFKVGDRVVDVVLESKCNRTFIGTVKKVFRNEVHVNWDVDSEQWLDTMYVDELRLASVEDENGPE